MPYVMGLEGRKPTEWERRQAQLYGAMPKPMLRGLGAISDYFAPFKAHPVILALGVVGGFWLARKKR